MTGTGAGVDGIDLGVGSLNAAVFRDGDTLPAAIPAPG